MKILIMKTFLLMKRPSIVFILLYSINYSFFDLQAQTLPFTPSGCEKNNECKFNQTTGSSTSVSVGVTNSMGVNSSAQASPSYTASASSSLILDSFSNPSNSVSSSSLLNYNSSIQQIGTDSNNISVPVNISIKSDSSIEKSQNGNKSFISDQDKINTSNTANNFSDDNLTSSNAEFSVTGFGGFQDVRLKGDDSGTKFSSSVLPIINTDEKGNQTIGSVYGTGNASAGAEIRSRLQADINNTNFINSFITAF